MKEVRIKQIRGNEANTLNTEKKLIGGIKAQYILLQMTLERYNMETS